MENEVTVALNARRLTLVRQDKEEDSHHEQVSTTPPRWSSLAAGYLAGSAGLFIGHPMDSIKVLIQTQGQAAASTTSTNVPRSAGPVGANTKAIAASIANSGSPKRSQQQTRGKAVAAFPMQIVEKANKRSILSLYAGIGAPLLSVGALQSLNFFLYDSLRRETYYYDHAKVNVLEYLEQDTIANVTTAAFVAGGLVSGITSPLQVLKTTQQLHPKLSMKGALQHIRGSLGLRRGLFVGFTPHFVCETYGRGVYFGVYETLKRYMSSRQRHRMEEDGLSLTQRMGAASVAGMTCWTAIYPMDVVRCRMYAMAAAKTPVLPVGQVVRDMYREGGIRPFFRGFGLTVVRAGPVAAVVLPVYDVTLEWLNQVN